MTNQYEKTNKPVEKWQEVCLLVSQENKAITNRFLHKWGNLQRWGQDSGTSKEWCDTQRPADAESYYYPWDWRQAQRERTALPERDRWVIRRRLSSWRMWPLWEIRPWSRMDMGKISLLPLANLLLVPPRSYQRKKSRWCCPQGSAS